MHCRSSGRCLGVFDHDVEIAVSVGKYACVQQLELGALAGATAVFIDEHLVGESPLGILVQEPHVGMRWRVVEVEVVFFDVLAVIAFGRRQTEEALLEDRIMTIPEGGGEDEKLVAVANAGDPIFAPAVGLAPGEVVRQEVPGVAVRAVVLRARSPRIGR